MGPDTCNSRSYRVAPDFLDASNSLRMVDAVESVVTASAHFPAVKGQIELHPVSPPPLRAYFWLQIQPVPIKEVTHLNRSNTQALVGSDHHLAT